MAMDEQLPRWVVQQLAAKFQNAGHVPLRRRSVAEPDLDDVIEAIDDAAVRPVPSEVVGIGPSRNPGSTERG